MKAINRFTKAILVIIIVGIGLVHNMNLRLYASDTSNSDISTGEKYQVKTDTLDAGKNRIYIYTKSIIRSGIQQLISNL
jgi:hypothetical protein